MEKFFHFYLKASSLSPPLMRDLILFVCVSLYLSIFSYIFNTLYSRLLIPTASSLISMARTHTDT